MGPRSRGLPRGTSRRRRALARDRRRARGARHRSLRSRAASCRPEKSGRASRGDRRSGRRPRGVRFRYQTPEVLQQRGHGLRGRCARANGCDDRALSPPYRAPSEAINPCKAAGNLTRGAVIALLWVRRSARLPCLICREGEVLPHSGGKGLCLYTPDRRHRLNGVRGVA